MSTVDAFDKYKGVKIINDNLEAWFNFHRKPDNDSGDFYAGSITSLLINNREFLDPVNSNLPYLYMFHDREKRCMQIDKVYLYDRGNNDSVCDISLFNAAYECTHHCVVNGVANVTVESCQFDYRDTKLRLRRVISLPANSSSIIEEVTLIGDNEKVVDLPEFSLSYYSHIHSRFSHLKKYTTSKLKNGFIMFYEDSLPLTFYGFSSSSSLRKFPEERISSFSWELLKSKKILNIHSFMIKNDIYPIFHVDDFAEDLLVTRNCYIHD